MKNPRLILQSGGVFFAVWGKSRGIAKIENLYMELLETKSGDKCRKTALFAINRTAFSGAEGGI